MEGLEPEPKCSGVADADAHENRPGAERFADLAATVAHELNNVLTVIRTYSYFARQVTSREQRSRDLRVVSSAAERGTALTEWLASTSERGPRAQDELSANDFVSTIAIRLQQLTVDGTIIEAVTLPDDAWFRANGPRLDHVIMSLVLAANQAFAGGVFKLAVERRVSAPEPGLSLQPDACVVLIVTCRADGPLPFGTDGISATERLAGLLAPLAELVQTMNGKLDVVPTNHDVAQFELHLPAIAQRSVPSVQQGPAVTQGGLILVVEDDAAIRLGMRRTLSNAGYSVLEASDAGSAKESLIELGQAVDLVVSDVVLPRARGPELFTWLKANQPSVALLLVSGREREGEAIASDLGAQFLGKPFHPAEFLASVRRAITDRGGALGEPAPTTERPLVLVVDDDADIRDSFERLLAECDFQTLLAKSGLHALQILGERHVDAVISDQFMPGLDGIGLLELVYQRFPRCTRILCTGHPSSDVVISAVNRGRVHCVLPKTMHAVALRDEIERALLDAGQATSLRREP